MKKILLLACIISSSIFANNNAQIELINTITDDLRGVAVDDKDCQNTVIEFHKKGANLASAELLSKYQFCMQKKNAVEILPFNTDQDEKDCKKAIFEFYGAVIDNGKVVELDKEFQHCMEKKAVAHAKEAKKELEHTNNNNQKIRPYSSTFNCNVNQKPNIKNHRY